MAEKLVSSLVRPVVTSVTESVLGRLAGGGGGGADAYIVNSLAPDTVVDYAGVLNSGTEYYRSGGVASDFDTMHTHTATSNATMFESGVLKWRPHNVLPYSSPGGTGWTTSNITATTGQTDSSGGTDASLLESTSTSNPYTSEATGSSAVSGVLYSLEVEVKAGNQNFCNVDLYQNGGSFHRSWYRIDLTDGSTTAITTTMTDCAVETEDIGGSWWRIKVSGRPTASVSLLAQLRPGLYGSYASGDTIYGGRGRLYRSDLGGMADNPDTSDSYVATSGSAVYLPRRNNEYYNGTSWVNGGVLVERTAATNLLTESRDFSTWSTEGSITRTKNATGIDGVASSAYTLEDTSGANYGAINLTGTVPDDSNPVTVTAYVKKTTSAASFPGMLVQFVDGTTSKTSYITIGTDSGTLNTESGTPDDTYITDEGDFWRVVYVYSNNSTGNVTCKVRLYAAVTTTEAGAWSVATQGSAVFDQVDMVTDSVVASSPIPTSGATATRAAETLKIDAAAMTFDSAAVSMAIEGHFTLDDTHVLAGWHSSTTEYAMLQVLTGNSVRVALANGGLATSTAASLTGGALAAVSAAGRFVGSTAAQAAAGGTADTADTTSVPALADLSGADLLLGVYTGTSQEVSAGRYGMFRQWDVDIGEAGIEEAST